MYAYYDGEANQVRSAVEAGTHRRSKQLFPQTKADVANF